MMSSARKNGTKWRKSLPPLVKRQHSAEIVCLTEMRLWEWEWVSGYWLLVIGIRDRISQIRNRISKKVVAKDDMRLEIFDRRYLSDSRRIRSVDTRSKIAYRISEIANQIELCQKLICIHRSQRRSSSL